MTDSSLTSYLLLNPACCDPQRLTAADIRHPPEGAPPVAVVDDPVFPAPLTRQLRLQPAPPASELDRQAHQWLHQLHADDQSAIGGWIESPFVLFALACALENSLVQPLPNGGRGMVRFFDPFVLQHLEVTLAPQQLGALLPFARRWHYRDLNGDLHTLTLTEYARHCHLTADQWASLKRLGTVRHLVQTWQSLTADSLPFDASLRVDRQLIRALDYGFSSQMDVAAYVLCGLLIDERFDQQPEFRSLIAQAQVNHNLAGSLNDALQAHR